LSEPSTVTGARRELGGQLNAFRKAAGFSQDELAKATGYSRSSIANIEAGRQNPEDKFWRECDRLLGANGLLFASWAKTEEFEQQSHLARAESARQAQQDRLDALKATLTETSVAVPQPRGTTSSDKAEVAAVVIHQAFEHMSEGGSIPEENQANDLERRALEAFQLSRDDRNLPLTLTLVGGYAGSGKSEFATNLSAITGWSIFDKDVLTRPLVEQLLLAHGSKIYDRESDIYLNKVRPFEYRSLIESGRQNLRAGNSTILCAPFLKEFKDQAWMERVRQFCTQQKAHLAIVWIKCDVESMFDYITYRSAARDEWKLEHWDEYVAKLDLDYAPVLPHYTVDNSLNAAVALAERAREVVGGMRV
jgi:predicted kinase/transcriptional regulator with XRE-family HTH domain